MALNYFDYVNQVLKEKDSPFYFLEMFIWFCWIVFVSREKMASTFTATCGSMAPNMIRSLWTSCLQDHPEGGRMCAPGLEDPARQLYVLPRSCISAKDGTTIRKLPVSIYFHYVNWNFNAATKGIWFLIPSCNRLVSTSLQT